MNEAQEIKKLKSELETTRGLLLTAQFKIMDLECTVKSTARRLTEIIEKIGATP